MPRVPHVRREDLAVEDQAIYDEIAELRGQVVGPFSVLMYSPLLAKGVHEIGRYVRYEAPIPARQRHLLALIAARELDCQYEFTVHANLARQHGIPDEVVEAIGRDELPSGLPEVEALLVAFVRQLVVEHKVDDATFEAFLKAVGMRHLTDIVGAVGYFSMAAFPLNAFDVEVRAEHTPLMPPRPRPVPGARR